jgi:bacillolysin
VPTTIEPDGWTGETEGPIVKDGHIAYVHYQWGEDSWSMGVDVLDLKTGKTAYGWQAPEAEWMSAPTVNSTGAYWMVDADYADEDNTIASVSFDGKATGPVIPEGTGHGVRAEMVTASDTTLTVMEDPTQADLYGPIGEAMLPKIRQFTLTGAPLGRVSCAPGAQILPAADTGRTVVWVDSRTSSNALVVGSKPKGSCA